MKIFAAFLLAAVGWLCGGLAADNKKQSYDELCGIISLLETVRDGICYARTGLYDIFASFGNKSLDYCGFTAILKSGDGQPIRYVWNEAVKTLSVGDKVLGTITVFGETLGVTDCETQTRSINACLDALYAEKEETGKLLYARLKSFRMLGALGGCMAAIMLY